MKKIYLTLIFIGIVCLYFSTGVQAQVDTAQNQTTQIKSIDELRIYPNPARGNKLFITSKLGKSKIVTIYNALGAKVLFEVMTTNELDISSLNPGVYVIKVKEEKRTASRKLVIN